MKPVRQPLSRLFASLGHLVGRTGQQPEVASPSLIDLPSFRHPQTTLFSISRSNCATTGSARLAQGRNFRTIE